MLARPVFADTTLRCDVPQSSFKDKENMKQVSPIPQLTEENLATYTLALTRRDSDLAHIYRLYGVPPLWGREPGFATLVQIILEQQVSLASAKAAFEQICKTYGQPTPDKLVSIDDATFKQVGVSRQKARYIRHLSQAIISGALDVDALNHASDEVVLKQLETLKGFGRWSSNVYLLMALRRADAWPTGDLALAKALQHLKKLPNQITYEELDIHSEKWRPYRAVAARLLWHYYLSRKASQ
jgi:DNA-3-methyladenine glycosylase II